MAPINPPVAADAPDLQTPTVNNVLSGVVDPTQINIRRPTTPQTFTQGAESANPRYTTDASGRVVPAPQVDKYGNAIHSTPSVKGTLGRILMGALQGAASGARAPVRVGGGNPFALGAAQAHQDAVNRDAIARKNAQQNFENQQKTQQQANANQQQLNENEEHRLRMSMWNTQNQTAVLQLNALKQNLPLEYKKNQLAVDTSQQNWAASHAQMEANIASALDLTPDQANDLFSRDHGPAYGGLTKEDAQAHAQGHSVLVPSAAHTQGPDMDGWTDIDTDALGQMVVKHNVNVQTKWIVDPKTGTVTRDPDDKGATIPAGAPAQRLIDLAYLSDRNYNKMQTHLVDGLKDEALKRTAEFGEPGLPKTIGDATSRYVQATQLYRQNPTPENKKIMEDAGEQKQSFLDVDAQEKRLEEAIQEGDPTPIAQMLLDGDVAPSQLSRYRGDVDKIMAAAAQLAKQQGKPVPKMNVLEAQYNYAHAPATQNTLNMIDSMEEPGGSLDIAEGAAANLPQMDQKTANKAFNATATEFGSSAITTFHTAMLGLADEYAKVMGGGVASDTGRQQALDILQDWYSKNQMAQGINVLQRDITARRKAIVRDNPVLKTLYPEIRPQTQQQQPNQPPSGATGQAPGNDGKMHWTNAQGQDLGVAQ